MCKTEYNGAYTWSLYWGKMEQLKHNQLRIIEILKQIKLLWNNGAPK